MTPGAQPEGPGRVGCDLQPTFPCPRLARLGAGEGAGLTASARFIQDLGELLRLPGFRFSLRCEDVVFAFMTFNAPFSVSMNFLKWKSR